MTHDARPKEDVQSGGAQVGVIAAPGDPPAATHVVVVVFEYQSEGDAFLIPMAETASRPVGDQLAEYLASRRFVEDVVGDDPYDYQDLADLDAEQRLAALDIELIRAEALALTGLSAYRLQPPEPTREKGWRGLYFSDATTAHASSRPGEPGAGGMPF